MLGPWPVVWPLAREKWPLARCLALGPNACATLLKATTCIDIQHDPCKWPNPKDNETQQRYKWKIYARGGCVQRLKSSQGKQAPRTSLSMVAISFTDSRAQFPVVLDSPGKHMVGFQQFPRDIKYARAGTHEYDSLRTQHTSGIGGRSRTALQRCSRPLPASTFSMPLASGRALSAR